jgi:hypothetical protein
MPEAVEGSHFGNADFRLAGKIFATLALEKEGYGVLLLDGAEGRRGRGRAESIFPCAGGLGP